MQHVPEQKRGNNNWDFSRSISALLMGANGFSKLSENKNNGLKKAGTFCAAADLFKSPRGIYSADG